MNSVAFVSHLESLRDSHSPHARAVLATLRRSMGRPLRALPHIARWLPDDKPWVANDMMLVGALFALHPQPGGQGDLGRQAAQAELSERRFAHLLNSHRDNLDLPLRNVVSFCRSKKVPIDYHQLYFDLRNWGKPDAYVQRRLAQSFWGSNSNQTEE